MTVRRGRPKTALPRLTAPSILLEPVELPTPTYWKGLLSGLGAPEIDQARKAQYDSIVSTMVNDRWSAALAVFDLGDPDFEKGPYHVAGVIFRRLFPGFELLQPNVIDRTPLRWSPSDPATVRTYARALELRAAGAGKLDAWAQAAQETMSPVPDRASLDTRWSEFRAWPWVKMFEEVAAGGPEGIQHVLTKMMPQWVDIIENPGPPGSDLLRSRRQPSDSVA